MQTILCGDTPPCAYLARHCGRLIVRDSSCSVVRAHTGLYCASISCCCPAMLWPWQSAQCCSAQLLTIRPAHVQVPGLFTDCSEDNRKVLLMRRLYDNGQDPIKLLPAASRDPHAVRAAPRLHTSAPMSVPVVELQYPS